MDHRQSYLQMACGLQAFIEINYAEAHLFLLNELVGLSLQIVD